MVRVDVINGTGEEIIIKEGNAGIYREVQKIRKDGNYVICVDSNATYREFLCVESKSGLTVTLTSDDCIDYEKSQSEKMEPDSFGILRIPKIQYGGNQESLRRLLIRTLGHGLPESSKRKVQHRQLQIVHLKVEYPRFEHLRRHDSLLCPHPTLLSSVVTPYPPRLRCSRLQ